VKILQLSFNSLSVIGRSEQDIADQLTRKVAIPLNYLSRYYDCYKTTLKNRQEIQDSLVSTWKEENEKKKKLEVLSSSVKSSSLSSSPESSYDLSLRHSNSSHSNNQHLIRSGYPDQESDEIKQKEDEIHLAKASLLETEKLLEMKKKEDEMATKSLKSECVRLTVMHKKKLMVRFPSCF
jgi:hypothetical protein